MKSPLTFKTALSTAALLLAISGGAGLAFSAEAGSRADAPDGAPANGNKPVLQKGMPAETIVRLIGKPHEVISMSESDGKAEKWIYRRLADERTVQTAATTHEIPAVTGFTINGLTIGTAVQLDQHLVRIKTYQVTSLLIFEGQLLLGKQWLEKERSFNN